MKRLLILILATTLGLGGFLAYRAHAQTAGDDLATALVNHGMDAVTAPIAAAAIEIAISNGNGLLQRLANDETAIALLQQQVNALTPIPPAPLPPPPTSIYALAVSLSSNRSGAIDLNGATLTGQVYIFTVARANFLDPNPSGIISACYWIDNPAASGTALHCEAQTPYDLNGGTAIAAAPWASSSLPNGPHTITQKIGTEIMTAAFTVAN